MSFGSGVSSPMASDDGLGSAPSAAARVSVDDISSMKAAFDAFDRDGSGSIAFKELKQVMKSMGGLTSDEQIQKMIDDSDCDGDGTVDFAEFIVMMNDQGLGPMNSAAPEDVELKPRRSSLVSVNRVDEPIAPSGPEPELTVFKRGEIEKEIGSRVVRLPEVELPPITDDRGTDNKVELTRGKIKFVPRDVQLSWQWKDQGSGSADGRVLLERWRKPTLDAEDEELVVSVEVAHVVDRPGRGQWSEEESNIEETNELLEGAWPGDTYRVCYVVGAGEKKLCIRNFQMTYREGCPVPVKDRVLADWFIQNHGLGKPKLVGPSSRYVDECITDAAKQWAEGSLLIPHEVFRFYHGMMLTIADNFPEPTDETFEWKARHFFTWFNKYYMPVIDHHHHMEEDIMIPWLAEKVTVPERVTAAHGDLLQRVEAISRYESIMDEGASSSQVATFRRMVRELVVEMNDHLAEEEATIPALIEQSVYTQKDFEVLVDQIVEALGLTGNMTFLPGILYCAEAWAGNQSDEMIPLPPAIEKINETYWQAAWEKESLAVLYALAMEDEEPPIGCCLNVCACPCQPDINGAELQCCYQTVVCPAVTCSVVSMICGGLPCCTMFWTLLGRN